MGGKKPKFLKEENGICFYKTESKPEGLKKITAGFKIEISSLMSLIDLENEAIKDVACNKMLKSIYMELLDTLKGTEVLENYISKRIFEDKIGGEND